MAESFGSRLGTSESSQTQGMPQISVSQVTSDEPHNDASLKRPAQDGWKKGSYKSDNATEPPQASFRISASSQADGREHIPESKISLHTNPPQQSNGHAIRRKNRLRFPRSFSATTTLYTPAHLIFFSILGTLARLGLEAITSYPNAPVVSPVLWANLGGSLVLGFLVQDRRIFREEWGVFTSPNEWSFHPTIVESVDAEMNQRAYKNHGKVKTTIPLFVGLATGFCGCMTSFSSFVRDAFLALSNELSPYSTENSSVAARNRGHSLEALLAILIIHPAVSIAALKLGAHLALALDPLTPTIPFKTIRQIIDPCIVVVGLGSWIGAVLLSVFPPHQAWRGNVTLALVFAPLGCLFRFYVSKYLNPRIAYFPLGTFISNMVGTIILGACFDLQHSPLVAEKVSGCQLLEGVVAGFCGCATTVSTWVVELTGLKRRHGYIYGLTSVIVALAFLISIMGSLEWSRGFQPPVCIS